MEYVWHMGIISTAYDYDLTSELDLPCGTTHIQLTLKYPRAVGVAHGIPLRGL